MEVFNKFYSSVSNTVSHLSGVLPGNPVIREFEATQFIGSAGPGLLWKIYKGYKKSTKQEASIFVFEKKLLERWSKTDREIMLDTLKRGIVQLTKLRHPQILTVQHSLEESRESIAFATEPVFSSLANILGNMENIPDPIPNHFNKYKLYELEIKYGLMQIAEGLTFLHNDVKLLHHNICPESIIVNQQGAWKIFGFDFCIANQRGPGSAPYWPFQEYCPAMHALTQPVLDYLAPEYVLSHTHSTASDMYSLGMVIYALHSTGHQTLGNVGNDYSRFKRFVTEIRNLPNSRLLCVTDGLRDYVKLLLNATPELRPDSHQFLKISYFEDVGVKTLNYLDSLFQWDNLQKSQFYKGLPQILQKMPHRICFYRVLPCLIKEFVNPPMVPFVLPNVLLIAENSSKEEFCKDILPVLKPIMLMQDPIQILLVFMQKMELLLKLTPPEDVKSDIIPMLNKALESDAQQIQELCLSVLPNFAALIEYPAMKNAILPRIKKLCLSTNYISVRVNCLLCMGKLLEHLDKWLVQDDILPFLPQITSREPAVLMGILGIYKLALSHTKLGITKEVLATKVLPFIIPLCIENGLTPNQFNSLISVTKQMISKLETEHRAKLEQLNSINNDPKAMEHSITSANATLVNAPPPASELDKMFSGLGMDAFSYNQPQDKKSTMSTVNDNVRTLSMEDKQRIAHQQDVVRNFSNKPYPKAVPAPRPTQKPVDLTTSLLQSNLSQLTKPLPSSVSNPNNHAAPGLGAPTPTYSIPSLTPNYSYQNQFTGFDNVSLSSASGNFNNKWATNNQNQSKMKQDWSAFESLLPTANNNPPPADVKKSTNNEMMDLLS